MYSDAKNGADIGTLVGRDAIGVAATTERQKILGLQADCVLYTPRNTSIDEVCAILASGKNVVTTAFLFHPQRIALRDHDRRAAACETGGTTVHGSGLNPGNLSGVLPLALSGMCRTIAKITLQERADWSVYESTSITFDNMAFGQPVEGDQPNRQRIPSVQQRIFEIRFGLSPTRSTPASTRSPRPWKPSPPSNDHQIFDHVLKAGTTAGQRWTWTGRRNAEPLVEIEALWTVGGEYPEHWPKPEHGWTLTIEGDPSMRTHFFALASFTRAATMEEHVRSASVATAMQILNAVAAVCSAPQGFATAATLPLIVSHTGFGNTTAGKTGDGRR